MGSVDDWPLAKPETEQQGKAAWRSVAVSASTPWVGTPPGAPKPLSDSGGRCPGERGGGKRIAVLGVSRHWSKASGGAPSGATSNLDNLSCASRRRWPTPANDSYLVDSASSHMLVSKIKPCMSKYKQLYRETANGSLYKLSFI